MTQILTKEKMNFMPALVVMIMMFLFTVVSTGTIFADEGGTGLTISDSNAVTVGKTVGDGEVNKVIATSVKAAKTVAGLVIAVAVLVVVFAGFKYATSQGDPKAMEGAKSQIIAAMIGIGISFLAVVLVTIVGNIFGINGQ